jgi:hypothetical protein
VSGPTASVIARKRPINIWHLIAVSSGNDQYQMSADEWKIEPFIHFMAYRLYRSLNTRQRFMAAGNKNRPLTYYSCALRRPARRNYLGNARFSR